MDELKERLEQARAKAKPNQEHICPICNGTGWEFYKDDNGVEWTRKCLCGLIDREQLAKKTDFAEIPPAFHDLRLASFRVDCYRDTETAGKMVDTIKYWLKNLDNMVKEGTGLYLFSLTKGTGKTRLAASLANELITEHHIPVKFVTSIQIINEIKSTWDDKTKSENDLLRLYSTIPVLVIDDFGAETVKDWISERFYHIINERYANKLVTIYTSNSRITNLKYDDRIINRILEQALEVFFPEESVRIKLSQEKRYKMMQAIEAGKSVI